MNSFGLEPGSHLGETLGLYSGNANGPLARKIARYLGIDLGNLEVFEFANENIFVQDPGQRPGA